MPFLITRKRRYTPKVAVLLTKADLLSDSQLTEVLEYVRAQLARNFSGTPQVFPYSTRPGGERLRHTLEAELITGTLARFAEERESIRSRKMGTLLQECADYPALSLKSAEAVESERQGLRQHVIGEREIVEEARSAIQPVLQHAAAATRSLVSLQLEAHQGDLERTLLAAFEREFPKWTFSLATMLSSFEEWLAGALREELIVLSIRERGSFLLPLHKVRKQAFRALQQFRERLSDRSTRAFGVPLRTTETEIEIISGSAASSTEPR